MSQETVQETSVIECRICRSKTTNDLILTPCLCRGSLAFVHYRCLERWLNFSSRNSCELCSYPFNVIENRRYTCLQSVRIWIRHPAIRTFIMCDLVIALILTIITLILFAICLFGLNRFVQEGHEQGIQTFWSEGLVHFFLIILMIGYIIVMYSMARDHIRPWYSWWIHCNNVRLVLEKNSVILPTPEPGINQATNGTTDNTTQNFPTECKHNQTEETSNLEDNYLKN